MAKATENKRTKIASISKKDLDFQTFRAGGPGGQNQNKRDTGVRIVHRESGAVGVARDERKQGQNKKLAFIRMTEHWKFKVWLSRLVAKEEIESSKTRRYTYKGKNISLENRKMDRD